MRFGRAETRLFLKGLGAGLAALLGLLSLASAALALTWAEINQQVARCLALENEALALVQGVKGARDAKSNKKEVAKIKKAEHKLGQVIDIYQTLGQTDLPPAKAMSSILGEIKSSVSRNLAMARQSLDKAQSLRRIVEKEGLGLVGSGVQIELVIGLKDLRYHTTLLQKRLQAQNLR